MTDEPTPGALEGIRVVEIASGGAVAYAAQLLAQSGAEVIRIEPPGGDAIRRAGPFPDDQFALDGGGLHRLLNGGKRSVALDITSESGARFAGKLVATSQLVIANWQTPAASPLPLADSEAMAELFPDTIYVSISPFGRTGPYADRKADSLIIEGAAGMSYVSGKPDREPMASGVEVAEYYAAAMGWIAGLAALADKEAGVEHHFVDVSMHEALSAADDHNLPVYIGTGAIRRRYYSRVLIIYPSDSLPVKDGYVAFVLAGFDVGGMIAELIEEPEQATNPIVANGQERLLNWQEFDEIVGPWMKSHTKAEVLQRSDEIGLAFADVATTEDLVSDAHLAERNYWETLPDGGIVPGPTVRFSETPLRVAPPPDLGEGTAELLELDGPAAALLWREEA